MGAEVAEVAFGSDAAQHVQRDRLRLLNAALDRATRANRPIIISRLPLPPPPSSQEPARPAYLTGDPALLSALQPLVSSPSSGTCLSLLTAKPTDAGRERNGHHLDGLLNIFAAV